MSKLIIGIDISKAFLEVAAHPGDAGARFSNDTKGHGALIKWLGRLDVMLVVFEATGAYHRALERHLAAAGLDHAKINPRQARAFAKAAGRLAKTDRVDALMLARFGALLEPSRNEARSQALQQLHELLIARLALIKNRTATKNRLHTLVAPLLKRQARQRLKQIETHIGAIDAAMRNLVETDQELARRFAILTSIPGIGALTAITLLTEMPELGALDKRQAAALAGLAPVTRQSGAWRGRAFIQGGRKILRDSLYMPALIAARFNPDLKPVYQRLISAGKPYKVAITAIMRKIVTIANAILRDNRTWTQNQA